MIMNATATAGLLDLRVLRELEQAGWLKSRQYGAYLIWDYTQKTQAHRHWTPETRMCRGLVTTATGEIVSRPFPKFFNLGEEPLPEGLGQPLVYEKVDGSLIVVSLHEGRRVVSSRAAMDNLHTRAAEEIMRDWMPAPGFTYCFELIHPEMRIVCNYGDERGLRLLAKIDTEKGQESELAAVSAPEWTGMRALRWLLIWPFDPEEHTRSNMEGFVLHWPEHGLRVKVKFAEYLRLHKLMTGVTPRAIWELLRDGRSLDPLYERVPDEFHAWMRAQEYALREQFAELLEAARYCVHLQEGKPRAEIARNIAHLPHRAAVFHLLDGKEPDRIIWELVKPGPARAFWNSGEAA